MIVDMSPKRFELSLPEGLENHPISAFGAIEKTRNVKVRIRSENGANSRACGWNEGHVTGLRRRRLRGDRPGDRRRRSRVGLCGLQNWLLFMPGAFAKHAVKA